MRVAIVLLVIILALPVPASGHSSTPIASPVASPVAVTDCEALPAYFRQVATLVEANEGMQSIPGSASTIASLPDADRATIAASLAALISELQAIQPPAPAAAWHRAYIDLVAWYRDLALATGLDDWQRVINRDRVVAREMSQAAFAGQTACGFDAWDRAISVLTA